MNFLTYTQNANSFPYCDLGVRWIGHHIIQGKYILYLLEFNVNILYTSLGLYRIKIFHVFTDENVLEK